MDIGTFLTDLAGDILTAFIQLSWKIKNLFITATAIIDDSENYDYDFAGCNTNREIMLEDYSIYIAEEMGIFNAEMDGDNE